jgi:hypothetical protein
MADENPITAEDRSIIAEQPENQEGRLVRLRPAVTFGLRAAALAGLVLGAGAGVAATGLTGIFDDDSIAVVAGPTCCWPDGNEEGGD